MRFDLAAEFKEADDYEKFVAWNRRLEDFMPRRLDTERSGRKAPPTDESAEDETSGRASSSRGKPSLGCINNCKERSVVIGAIGNKESHMGWRRVKVPQRVPHGHCSGICDSDRRGS